MLMTLAAIREKHCAEQLVRRKKIRSCVGIVLLF